MNAILLWKEKSQIESELKLLQLIYGNENLSVEVLHVISSFSEVPLKPNGEVIDICYDYDLSELEKQKKEYKEFVKPLIKQYDFISNCEVVIGDFVKYYDYKIENGNYDLVILGGHESSYFEDVFKETRTNQISKNNSIPLLSLKRNEMDQIQEVGVFADLQSFESEIIPGITKSFSTGKSFNLFLIHEGGVKELDNDFESIKSKFQNLGCCRLNVNLLDANSLSKEEAIKSVINEYQLDFAVVADVHRKENSWWKRHEIKTDLLNHINKPVLVF